MSFYLFFYILYSCLYFPCFFLNVHLCFSSQEDSVSSWTKPGHHIWAEGMHAPEPSCCDVS